MDVDELQGYYKNEKDAKSSYQKTTMAKGLNQKEILWFHNEK
jgi:hypothetical protein